MRCYKEEGSMKIGIIGCGNITSMLHHCLEDIAVAAVYDRHLERAKTAAKGFGAEAADSFDAFLCHSFDLVIEAASVEAVTSYARPLLERGVSLVLLSSGALADVRFKGELEQAARRHNARIHIPSGAIFGLDNASIGRIGGLKHVVMKTTKPPRSFHTEVEAKQCLFKGSAFECIRHFPKNANAAVSLSLAAGVDADVELWTDPHASTIRHEIVMEGVFGSVTIGIDNRPSEHNPSTSHLAALSVCALLRTLGSPLSIGS